ACFIDDETYYEAGTLGQRAQPSGVSPGIIVRVRIVLEMSMPKLKFPEQITACLFDLDGVLTQTASVHARAWKEMFDTFLKEHAEKMGGAFHPFEIATDYTRYVDGKLREDGVRDFLASRDITLPEGSPDDPPTAGTINGLATRKNDLFHAVLTRDGLTVYESSVHFVEAVRDAGMRRAVVSASKNTKDSLD